MAILYTFTVTDATGAGAFPPSITGSDWYANYTNYTSVYGIGGNQGYSWSLIFDDKTDLATWLTDYTITDPQLLSDLNSWSVDHQVTYSHKFYTLPETSGTGMF